MCWHADRIHFLEVESSMPHSDQAATDPHLHSIRLCSVTELQGMDVLSTVSDCMGGGRCHSDVCLCAQGYAGSHSTNSNPHNNHYQNSNLTPSIRLPSGRFRFFCINKRLTLLKGWFITNRLIYDIIWYWYCNFLKFNNNLTFIRTLTF